VALAIYSVLGLLAIFTLDGDFRIGTLIVLGLIALKSWLVVLRAQLD
jgi:diacylglycerol kinase